MGGDGPFGQDSGGRKRLPLVTVENFHVLRKRQTADEQPSAAEKANAAPEEDR